MTAGVVLLAGCSGDSAGTAAAPAPGAGACEAVRTVPVQEGSHLIGDAPPPVPYSSTPPTSGWHASGTFQIAVQPPDAPLTEPLQVSVLEAGGVVVTYNDIPAEDLDELVARVREHYPDRVAVTSYDKLSGGEVAVAAFGVLQRCQQLDLAALDDFVNTYADEQPAVPGTVD